MITFKCHKCKESISSPESMAGQEETCPNCGNVAVVPQTATPVPVQVAPIQQVSQPVPQYTPPHVGLDVNVKGIKSTNGLGIAALVLGIIAVLTCWIPFVGILGIPLAVLGLLFGIIGFLIALIGRKSGVGMPISGCIVCIVSIIVAVASTGGPAAAVVAEASKKATKQDQRFTGNTVITDQKSNGGRSIDRPPSISPGDEPKSDSSDAQSAKKAYLYKVLLNDVHVGQSVLDEKGVFGEIKNAGDRTLKEVEIMIYCLDKNGKEVFEKSYYPVLVTESRFSLREDKPLKPNYSTKFGCKLDDAPSEWSGKVRVVVTNIEFAD